MNDTKPWWQSKTILAAGVAALSGLAGILSHNKILITDVDQASLVESISTVVATLSGIIAVFTRATSTATLTKS